jgi:hypothetical protein
MTVSILPDERDQAVDVVYEKSKRLDWVVREDPKLEAELNQLPDNGEELSSAVVNKVLDRIKDL